MTKKEHPKKLSKDAILAEAKQLFSTKGYRATTLRDLTSCFGVSRPSLYYYYKSKSDILHELHSMGFNAAAEGFETILSTELPTKEKLRKILEEHIRQLVHDTALTKVLYLDQEAMPDKLKKDISKRRKGYTERIVEVYKRGIEEGIFKDIDPKLAVYLLIGACNWLIMWYSLGKTYKPEMIVESLMTILCEGYEVEQQEESNSLVTDGSLEDAFG